MNETEKSTEQVKLVEKVNQLVIKLCRNPQITKESIRTKIVSIDIQKLIGNQIFGRNITLGKIYTSYAGSFSITLPFIRNRKRYCLAIIQMPKDYLGAIQEDIIYAVKLYDISQQNKTLEVNNLTSNSSILTLVPNNGLTEKQCLFYSSQWSLGECETVITKNSRLACKCHKLGYIKLGEVSNIITTESLQTSVFTTISTVTSSLAQVTYIPDIEIHLKGSTSLVNTEATFEERTTVREIITTFPTNTVVEIIEQTTNLAPISNQESVTLSSVQHNSSTKVAKASAMNYVLPGLGIGIIFLIIAAMIFFRRNYTRKIKSVQELEIMSIEKRDFSSGIKYAKFYDEHLMDGSLPVNNSYNPLYGAM